MTQQLAHRIEIGRPMQRVVDSHGPGAEVEVTIDGRVARVRTRRHGRAFSADQMIAAAFAQLGIAPSRP